MEREDEITEFVETPAVAPTSLPSRSSSNSSDGGRGSGHDPDSEASQKTFSETVEGRKTKAKTSPKDVSGRPLSGSAAGGDGDVKVEVGGELKEKKEKGESQDQKEKEDKTAAEALADVDAAVTAEPEATDELFTAASAEIPEKIAATNFDTRKTEAAAATATTATAAAETAAADIAATAKAKAKATEAFESERDCREAATPEAVTDADVGVMSNAADASRGSGDADPKSAAKANQGSNGGSDGANVGGGGSGDRRKESRGEESAGSDGSNGGGDGAVKEEQKEEGGEGGSGGGGGGVEDAQKLREGEGGSGGSDGGGVEGGNTLAGGKRRPSSKVRGNTSPAPPMEEAKITVPRVVTRLRKLPLRVRQTYTGMLEGAALEVGCEPSMPVCLRLLA